jgi:hypothetical protein
MFLCKTLILPKMAVVATAVIVAVVDVISHAIVTLSNFVILQHSDILQL